MPRRRLPEVSGKVLTKGERDDIALSPEALSIRQRNCARMLAIGYSQQKAADAVAVDVRTVRRWQDEPGFAELVEQLHQSAWTRVEDAVMATLEHAIEVQQQMLRGEVKPDDKRYLEASRLIDRLLDKLFSRGAPTGDAGAAADGPPPSTESRRLPAAS